MPGNPPSSTSVPARLAVLLSGAGSTLANLLARIADGRLRDAHVVQVISSRAHIAGVDVARAAGLPPVIIRRVDHATPREFSAAITAALDAARPDLVLLAGFLCCWELPPRYQGRTLNIHPALLPKFGGRGMHGRHVHEAVLAAGERESGCTVHWVDAEYDHGPIVAQMRVAVQAGDTPDSLAARVGQAERELYPAVVQWWVQSRGGARPSPG